MATGLLEAPPKQQPTTEQAPAAKVEAAEQSLEQKREYLLSKGKDAYNALQEVIEMGMEADEASELISDEFTRIMDKSLVNAEDIVNFLGDESAKDLDINQLIKEGLKKHFTENLQKEKASAKPEIPAEEPVALMDDDDFDKLDIAPPPPKAKAEARPDDELIVDLDESDLEPDKPKTEAPKSFMDMADDRPESFVDKIDSGEAEASYSFMNQDAELKPLFEEATPQDAEMISSVKDIPEIVQEARAAQNTPDLGGQSFQQTVPEGQVAQVRAGEKSRAEKKATKLDREKLKATIEDIDDRSGDEKKLDELANHFRDEYPGGANDSQIKEYISKLTLSDVDDPMKITIAEQIRSKPGKSSLMKRNMSQEELLTAFLKSHQA